MIFFLQIWLSVKIFKESSGRISELFELRSATVLFRTILPLNREHDNIFLFTFSGKTSTEIGAGRRRHWEVMLHRRPVEVTMIRHRCTVAMMMMMMYCCRQCGAMMNLLAISTLAWALIPATEFSSSPALCELLFPALLFPANYIVCSLPIDQSYSNSSSLHKDT